MSPLLLSLLLLLLTTTSSTATTIGVTYNPSTANLPPPEQVASALQSLHISAVHMTQPTPSAVRAFSYTNITLLLTVPNPLLPSFAHNISAANLWLYNHVLPFHPRTKISLISAGSDPLSSSSSSSSSFDDNVDPSTTLLPAMRNLHLSLLHLGINTIQVSTTFSFISIITTSFPPSSSEFQEPANTLIIRPLLRFLSETNSSFLIDLYPYNVYRINSEIPVGFALFEDNPFNFRDDVITGVRYRNLFDMMVDAVIAAMAVAWQENVPVIVAKTGWPSDSEAQAAGNYAEMYLKGLMAHLRSGLGTPLRKEGVAEAYIYQLFDDGDDDDDKGGVLGNGTGSGGAGQRWGIMYRNMTAKYKLDFSGSGGKKLMGCGFRVLAASLVSILIVLVSIA